MAVPTSPRQPVYNQGGSGLGPSQFWPSTARGWTISPRSDVETLSLEPQVSADLETGSLQTQLVKLRQGHAGAG